MKPDQPASIPTAILAFAGTIAPLVGVVFSLTPETILALGAFIMGAAGLVVAWYLNRTTTSNTAPVVDKGTEVAIVGSNRTVTADIPPQVGTADAVAEGGSTPNGG